MKDGSVSTFQTLYRALVDDNQTVADGRPDTPSEPGAEKAPEGPPVAEMIATSMVQVDVHLKSMIKLLTDIQTAEQWMINWHEEMGARLVRATEDSAKTLADLSEAFIVNSDQAERRAQEAEREKSTMVVPQAAPEIDMGEKPSGGFWSKLWNGLSGFMAGVALPGGLTIAGVLGGALTMGMWGLVYGVGAAILIGGVVMAVNQIKDMKDVHFNFKGITTFMTLVAENVGHILMVAWGVLVRQIEDHTGLDLTLPDWAHKALAKWPIVWAALKKTLIDLAGVVDLFAKWTFGSGRDEDEIKRIQAEMATIQKAKDAETSHLTDILTKIAEQEKVLLEARKSRNAKLERETAVRLKQLAVERGQAEAKLDELEAAHKKAEDSWFKARFASAKATLETLWVEHMPTTQEVAENAANLRKRIGQLRDDAKQSIKDGFQKLGDMFASAVQSVKDFLGAITSPTWWKDRILSLIPDIDLPGIGDLSGAIKDRFARLIGEEETPSTPLKAKPLGYRGFVQVNPIHGPPKTTSDETKIVAAPVSKRNKAVTKAAEQVQEKRMSYGGRGGPQPVYAPTQNVSKRTTINSVTHNHAPSPSAYPMGAFEIGIANFKSGRGH